MPTPAPNTVVFDSFAGSSILAGSPDACESFLESYSRGNVDVGGVDPPDDAYFSVAADVLASGHFPPPNPPDERQRVRELYQFRVLKELNHDVKLGFDRFARLATLVCDAKISIVTFLDDKTQYCSSEAAPAPWLIHTPIAKSLSICGHTILRRSSEIFEIPDTTEDWRFKGKPYVVGEPHIRYYAGAPLRTKSGYNIGSLCVLDFVPKKLSQDQIRALKDLANLIMTDLELHRDKELVSLKGRMANSINQFTRGLIKRELPESEVKQSAEAKVSTRGRTREKGSGWAKRSSSADRTRESDVSDGAMGFNDLGAAQKKVDADPQPANGIDDDSEETADTDTESVTSSQLGDEIDLKAMYRYACQLMRETLDVEGVCFVDIDGIDWGSALIAPNHRDEENADTHAFGVNRREFGAASSILGYAHSSRFGERQRKGWPSLARWDEEVETTNLKSSDATNPMSEKTALGDTFPDSEFPSQTGHLAEDGSYVSTRTGSHFEGGGFSNQFLARFLLENPYGKIFNDGLPDEIQEFLPPGVTSAIIVPIYNFDQHPFAMTCAYSTNPNRWFVDAEKRYLEGFGSQILSQVLKKRIIMADRAKALFISNISHELRSPLHGILASAEFLSDTPLDTLQRTFIDTIDSCARTLLEVINQVLEFGKLTYIERIKNKVSRPHIQRTSSKDAVPPAVNLPPVDLMAIAEQVVESCYAGHEFKGIFGPTDAGSLAAEQKNDRKSITHGFGRAKDPTSALTVVIDVDYRDQGWFFLLQTGPFQRILMNITGNALKYTSKGWVRVYLTSSNTGGQQQVHMIVSDSGKGISPEFLKTRLFSPFSQEDALQTGTGLGMSIVKQFVDRLGGQIHVTSQVSVGTKVHVTLPATVSERPAGPDICARVRSLTKDMKVFLAGFDKNVPASRLLYESMAHYLTNWYNMQLVDDVYSSDLIVSDECPELHDYFQQRSPSDYYAFGSPFSNSPQPLATPSITQSVYRAWQPLIVLCSNALRYELFGQQAETGKIIDFSSKPCGPYKLARSLLFCLEQAESRSRSMDTMMDHMQINSPRRGPSRTPSSISASTEDLSPISESGQPHGRRGSLGKGAVRFSPSVRRGSTDLGASMYVPGKGFVPTQTSSIVEPHRFVGVRRKSSHPNSLSTNSEDGGVANGVTEIDPSLKMPTVHHRPPTPENHRAEQKSDAPTAANGGSPPSLYNRRNPPRSVSITSPNIPPMQVGKGTPSIRVPQVLIVEDNSVNAMILATFLRKRGYPFAQAENGLLAVQAVQARPEGFDVILMDIQMPVMDGSSATAAIRTIENERGSRRAFIVALTGLAEEKDREIAFESGVDHFLTKPVSLKKLGEVIGEWEQQNTDRGFAVKPDTTARSEQTVGA